MKDSLPRNHLRTLHRICAVLKRGRKQTDINKAYDTALAAHACASPAWRTSYASCIHRYTCTTTNAAHYTHYYTTNTHTLTYTPYRRTLHAPSPPHRTHTPARPRTTHTLATHTHAAPVQPPAHARTLTACLLPPRNATRPPTPTYPHLPATLLRPRGGVASLPLAARLCPISRGVYRNLILQPMSGRQRISPACYLFLCNAAPVIAQENQ